MRILIWHLHGSWTTAFVQGPHEYLVPVTPGRGTYGLGRAVTWEWPSSVREVSPSELATAGADLVVLQRPAEFRLASEWLGLTPGVDIPAVYLEHDPPPAPGSRTRHPMAGTPGLRIVHVTGFNARQWDCEGSPTLVVEHGIADPGARWTGELQRAGVVVNDPMRRGWSVGTDLLPGFARVAPLDVFGMRVTGLAHALGMDPDQCAEFEDLPQHRVLTRLARRRVYIHPFRWTSLGLSLIEAMHLAMPVVVFAATEAPAAVPQAAGRVSSDPAELQAAVRRLVADRAAAAAAGSAAREVACQRYGLKRFLDDWNHVLAEACR